MAQARILAAALLAAMASPATFAEEAGDGRALYETECAYCHFSAELPLAGRRDPGARLVPVMMATYGPRLAGIVGRAAGADPAFNYSESFVAETRGLVWTAPNLDRLMTDARAMIPGVRMFYRQPDANIRRKILAYLETAG